MKQPLKPTDRAAAPRHRRQRQLPLSLWERISLFVRRTLHIPTLQPDGEFLSKLLLCTVMTVFLALLQTTIFAHFRPFGAVPDLMLPLVIAIGMTEGERWGALWGLFAAFIIESLGTEGISLLPLLYMPAGYFCPIVTELYFTDTPPVRFIYTAVSGLGRTLITLIILALTTTEFHLPSLFSEIIVPEFASTFVMAPFVHIIVYLVLHPFHKSRSERVGTL